MEQESGDHEDFAHRDGKAPGQDDTASRRGPAPDRDDPQERAREYDIARRQMPLNR